MEFKLPWREAGPLNHHDDEVNSDQKVVNQKPCLSQHLSRVSRVDSTFLIDGVVRSNSGLSPHIGLYGLLGYLTHTLCSPLLQSNPGQQGEQLLH